MNVTNIKIGFIGQGWIGKNYADNFEERGFNVVRYDKKEPKLKKNKSLIADCDIVFVAVPTPTIAGIGFDDSILFDVAKLVGDGNVLVIKSTVLPDVPERLQDAFPNIYVIHCPEFLTEKTARFDVDNPARNVIGYTPKSVAKAGIVKAVLPHVKDTVDIVCPAKEAAAIKYGGNIWFYFKVLFMNTLYDFCAAQGIDFDCVKEGMKNDPRVGPTHLDVLHQGGRGAGGHCFPKDAEAYRLRVSELLAKCANDTADNNRMLNRLKYADSALYALAKYNEHLLKSTGKDSEITEAVYGI